MDNTIVVALLSMAGTLIGSVAGIMTANKLTVYRIDQLEKKVDKHNTVIERVAVLERDQKTAFRLIDEEREERKRG
jgi:hypothetical protein